jgi:hypothetical protein
MTRSRKLAIAAATFVALGAGGIGIAQAGDDGDEQATGPAADRAKQAAVEAVGAARAVSAEREDEGATAWEVEVVTKDGRQTEVDLGRDLTRPATESDDDATESDDDDESKEADEDGDGD